MLLYNNPNFEKLLIKGYVPEDCIKEILKNDELNKMIKLFHDDKKDVTVRYSNSCLWFDVDNISILKFFDRDFFNFGRKITTQLALLKKGFAQETYNDCVQLPTRAERLEKKHRELYNEVKLFNDKLQNKNKNEDEYDKLASYMF